MRINRQSQGSRPAPDKNANTRKSLLSRCSAGREKRLRVSCFGTGGVDAVVRHFEQHCVVLAGFRSVARGFGGHAGVKETIEAVGAKLQGMFVFDEGVLGPFQFKQHVGEHFARRDVDFFLVPFCPEDQQFRASG